MSTQVHLRKWGPGKTKLSNDRLNEGWNLLEKVASALGFDVSSLGPIAKTTPMREIRLGKVVTAGPNSEANYTDARYWVQECAIDSGASDAAAVVVSVIPAYTTTDPADGSTLTVPTIRTVTNLPEVPGGTHLLAANTPVLFVGFYDGNETAPNVRSVMAIGAPAVAGVRDVTVRLTQNGGTNGSDTTAPSYTYDCYAFAFDGSGNPTNGALLATAVAPLVPWPRGPAPAATYGQGVTDGTYFKLVYAYEVPDTGVC